MAPSSRASSALVLIAVTLATASASAHRHDELLQASRIGIDEHRVQLELSLTAGIAIADGIIGEIDRDGDGVLSSQERAAYANEALSKMALTVDGRSTRISLVGASFPAIDALRTGDARIDLHAIAAVPRLRSGKHQVSFENAYRRDIGVYLMNALAPDDDRTTITLQQRDPEQRTTMIDFELASAPSAVAPLVLIAPVAAVWLFARRRQLPYLRQRS
jgi:hypothetical protein